jgi:biopolymer transport protein ExbB
MRRSSRFSRIALFVVLIGASLFAASAYAQTAAPAAGGAAAADSPKPPGLISLILGNTDFVFFTVVLLSIIGMTLIIQGFIKTRQSVYMPDSSTEQIREMINQRKFKELLEYTRDDPSFISKALHPALNRAPAFNAMKEAMETAIGEQMAEKFRGIEYLNIIGNLGPLLGLLGTVLGMIAAFSEMMAAGAAGADPSKLAGGISKALCHTFLGLMLAVPCLASFGILRTMVDRLTVRAALLCEELLLLIKPQQETKPAGPAPVAGRPGMATPQPGAPLPPGVRKAPTPMPPPAPAV